MKFKRLVPLALALAIASTAAAEAARLPQNRFSFAVRPSYTQTVSRPSASKPSQSTAANSSYAAQVVSLVNAERARQGLPALTVSTTVQQAAQTRAGELQTSFSHTRPSGASCFTALTEAGVSYTRAGEEHRLWSEHTGGCCPVVDELVRPPREHSQQQLHHHRHRLYRCERNRILGAAFHCINAKQTAFAVCLGCRETTVSPTSRNGP